MDLEEIVRKSISIEEVNESQDKYFEFVLMPFAARQVQALVPQKWPTK